MQKLILVSACVLLAWVSFSQPKNRISFLYSPASNSVDIKRGWIGDMGHTGKGANLFELRYSRSITSVLSIETGVQYSDNKVETNYFPDGEMHYMNSRVKLISVPVCGNLTFLNYFFAEAGPTFDFELHHQLGAPVQNQGGIGLALGAGGKYTWKNATVFVNPFMQRHLLVSLGSEEPFERLWQSGLKFGVGYSF